MDVAFALHGTISVTVNNEGGFYFTFQWCGVVLLIIYCFISISFLDNYFVDNISSFTVFTFDNLNMGYWMVQYAPT